MRRLVDVVGAIVALIVGSPFMVLAAIMIRLTMGSPIFFRQTRAGLGGRAFQLVKFRTMRGTAVVGKESTLDPIRITRVGSLLRRLSIDELPQFYNVLRGEMSLIGPRPLLMEYLPLYSPRQARRQDVKPGITGLAQVSGRNSLEWEDRLEMDAWYVDHRSLGLDMKILARTALHVLHLEGASGAAHQISPRFTGERRP